VDGKGGREHGTGKWDSFVPAVDFQQVMIRSGKVDYSDVGIVNIDLRSDGYCCQDNGILLPIQREDFPVSSFWKHTRSAVALRPFVIQLIKEDPQGAPRSETIQSREEGRGFPVTSPFCFHLSKEKN